MLCPSVLREPCQSIQWKCCAIYLGAPGSNEAVACSVLPFSSGTGHRGLLKASTGGWCTGLSGLWHSEKHAQMVPFGIIPNPEVGVWGS